MAGSKSKDSNDASELARLQKKISAVWDHDASEVFSLAEELRKSRTRLGQLASLYTLLKTPLLQQHKQEKTKPVEWGTKYKSLLDHHATSADPAVAAAAKGQKPSLVAAWAVSAAYSHLATVEDEEDKPFFWERVCDTLQGSLSASGTQVEQWLQQWADPVPEYPAAVQDEAAKYNSQQLKMYLGRQAMSAWYAALLGTDQQELAVEVKAMVAEMMRQLHALGSKAGAKEAVSKEAATKEQQLKQQQQQLERNVSPTPNSQQQASKRGKEGDKLQDAKRGRAGDVKAAQELELHKERLKAVEEKAAQGPPLQEPMLEPKWQRPSVSVGLENMTNTCYFNSVMQCLAHLPPLANLCLAQAHKKSCEVGLGRGCLCCMMEAQIHQQLYSINRLNFAPRRLYDRVMQLGRNFTRYAQEDAHELLRCLTDRMEGCLLRQALGCNYNPHRRPRCPTTLVNRLFQGILQSQVRCLECGHVSNSYDPFMDLSLELAGSDMVKCNNMPECLQHFTKPEKLDGNNLYRCDGCKKEVEALKHITIWDDPNILVVHLKRFSYLTEYKLTNPLPYPAVLNLEPFMCHTRRLQQQPRAPQQQQQGWQQPRPPQQQQCQRQQQRGVAVFNGSGYSRLGNGQTPKFGLVQQASQQQQQQQRALHQRQQQHQMFLKQQQQQHHRQQQQQEEVPAAAAAAGGPSNRTTPGRYMLHAVLVHAGSSINSGHYFAYVRTGRQLDEWYCHNDSIVTRVSTEEAMHQVRRAYMLFYVRCDMKDQAQLPGQPEAAAAAAAAVPDPAAAAGARPKRALQDESSEAAGRLIGPQLPPHLQAKRQRLADGDQMDVDAEEQPPPAAAAAARGVIGPQLPPGWRPSAVESGNNSSGSDKQTMLRAVAAAAAEVVTAASAELQAATNVPLPGAAAAAAGVNSPELAAAADVPLPPAAAAARAAEARMAAAKARGQPKSSSAIHTDISSSSAWQPFTKPSQQQQGSTILQNGVGSSGGDAVRAQPDTPVVDNALAGLLPDYDEDEDDMVPAVQLHQAQQSQGLAQQQEHKPHHNQQQQQEEAVVQSQPAGAGSPGEDGVDSGRAPNYERLKSELSERLAQRLPDVKPQLVQGLTAARDKGLGLQQCKAHLMTMFLNSSPVKEVFSLVLRAAQSAVSLGDQVP